MKNSLKFCFLAVAIITMVSCDPLGEESDTSLFTPDRSVSEALTDPNVTYCGDPKTVTLWAGQFTDAGSVTIYNDATNLYVTVHSDLGYQAGDEQIKMWVGGDLLDLPRAGGPNGPGAPINGQFPYKITTVGGTTYTFTIPLNDLSLVNACGDQIFVVVHADVVNDDGNGGTETNTAYSGDIPGDGSRWWYYTDYNIQCCDGTPPVLDHCETAFAKGDWVFASNKRANPEKLPSLNLNRMRWGWAVNVPLEDGSETYDVWAGAGLNNTDKGTLVGTVTVAISGTQVTVSYDLDAGYTMQEAHIYAGDFAPTTIAPGQYGHTEYFDPMVSTYSETFDVSDTDGDGIWVIAHAVACW